MVSENLRVFLAAKDHQPDILELLELQFNAHEINLPAQQLQSAVEAVFADQRLGFFLLAETETRIVGLACVSFCWTLEHGGKSAWLDELYVLPGFRSQGIGEALVAAALQTAKERGCAAVDLEVDAEHREAERLYQRFGFESLPRTRWVKVLR